MMVGSWLGIAARAHERSTADMNRWTCVASLMISSTSFAGEVWVVDASGGGQFTQIQPAVDIAADGDTVLVRSGTYEPFTISHEGLAVCADLGASVLVDGGIRVVNTLMPHQVVLVGLESRGAKVQGDQEVLIAFALELDTVRGPVRVEDCVFVGADGFWGNCGGECEFDGEAAVSVFRALDVAFQGCQLSGGIGYSYYGGGVPNRGGEGLSVRGGALALFHCEVSGGRGGEDDMDDFMQGGDGGHGALVVDDPLIPATMLYSAGSTIRGGAGGSVVIPCLEPCGDGGNGLILSGATTAGHLLDTVLEGGPAGCSGAGCGELWTGVPGEALVLVNGASASSIPGLERSLEGPSPMREATTAALEFSGKSGDLVHLVYSARPAFELFLPWNGVWLLERPGLMGYRFMGVIPPSGILQTSFAVPALPAALESSTLLLQSLHRDLTGRRWLGGHWALVILDSAF
jgi:hypothetical protein